MDWVWKMSASTAIWKGKILKHQDALGWSSEFLHGKLSMKHVVWFCFGECICKTECTGNTKNGMNKFVRNGFMATVVNLWYMGSALLIKLIRSCHKI